jgi:hypothetical protein
MGISVSAVSRNTCLINYNNITDEIECYSIGHIGESFDSEKKSIKNKRIKQFMYITIMANTIFNTKQLIALSKELDILEKLDLINKQDFDIIKNGVKIALEKNLYLKFEYD